MLRRCKMAETIETMPETMPATIDNIPEKEEKPETTPVAEPSAEPAPKKRGRPKGAPDKAPRKKKIVIVEQPAETSEASTARVAPETVKPAAQVAPPESPPVKTEPEPPSPRSLMREASKHILQLQTLRDVARRNILQNAYTKNLHSLI